ncbi:2-dehydro-3-deoxygalactonokinase [Rhizobium sp. Leaf262]|uniref:2-dehydro-3-deoxygalactonokinase n=1 Tax=Rhizobium sp. Leaf262 TaxID=1736312 RepID=UPI000712D090|nr:2-dehydro-3-deoxygalactonokinase [Rhizobium sp. Leaf262]KQO78859.1 2-dehydro-3-deoxygalactonokinase [Rhizobium sp. Leaf262]
MSDAAFVAVDWGTTSFRLWLISRSGEILGERRSSEGMTTAMQAGFSKVLASHLSALSAPSGLPVIICGMAGARQGWVEAGYVDVPADLKDVLKGAVTVSGEASDVRILPGLAQRSAQTPDVMRGEETQLLGALSADYETGEQLVCMPGTHSKWVNVRDMKVTGFSTFMTGELFDVISKHSILSHAVANADAFTGDLPAFRDAVTDSYANPHMATNRLFTVRSGQLLHGLSATDAKAKLSGTMIGLEIAGAHANAAKAAKVVLIASGSLGELYKAAFAALSMDYVTIDADEAVRRGLITAANAIWH